ncbi:hypothetical protein Pan161_16450 [Gimesia algae]|uniref:Uncharacterized protein n=1 Tax=Gimesia algae TaxID=2527971 RepID=A0A517VAI0_9PLAN|nr:hypothetical protein Pan161_16450 [Gimesia algae]
MLQDSGGQAVRISAGIPESIALERTPAMSHKPHFSFRPDQHREPVINLMTSREILLGQFILMLVTLIAILLRYLN